MDEWDEQIAAMLNNPGERMAPFAMPLVYTDTDRISRHHSPPADLDHNPYPPGDVGTLTEPGASASYRVTVSGRPWPPPAAEIPVTDEMKVAGGEARELHGLGVFSSAITENEVIYRAMRSLEPVSPVSYQAEHAAHLETAQALRWTQQDREKARGENQALGKLYCETTERNGELNTMIERQAHALGDAATEIALLRQALAMKDARIGELKSVLASTPVAFEDPDAKPEPARNPFRDFGHDPRRMGPL